MSTCPVCLDRLQEEQAYSAVEKQIVQMGTSSSYRTHNRIGAFSPAARGGNLAKIPPNQVIADFGRGSSVE